MLMILLTTVMVVLTIVVLTLSTGFRLSCTGRKHSFFMRSIDPSIESVAPRPQGRGASLDSAENP